MSSANINNSAVTRFITVLGQEFIVQENGWAIQYQIAYVIGTTSRLKQ